MSSDGYMLSYILLLRIEGPFWVIGNRPGIFRGRNSGFHIFWLREMAEIQLGKVGYVW